MQFDWQTIAVALIVAGALFYVARRGYARLRAFASQKGGAGCATGCGKCGGDEVQPSRPANVMIQISPSRNGARRR